MRIGVIVGVCLVLIALFSLPAQASTLTVANTNDSGGGSLRDALATASAGDTIVFAVTGSIALASPLAIAQTVTIQGPGSANLTLNGQSSIQVINLTAGTLTLSGITIANGSTITLGGGILVASGATLAISQTVFLANQASNGAAITNQAGAVLTVDESTFNGNAATSVGGGGIMNFGTLTVSNSTFLDNTAQINGGAINTQPQGTTTVINSTFVGNTTASLGGAFSNLGTTNIYDSSISANTASGGSALATGNSSVLLYNNVFADNTPDALNPVGTIPGSNNVFFNNNAANDATGYGTTNFIFTASEPLNALANNGGPTQTQLPVAGSSAICAGSIALLPAGLTRDQRGLSRTSGSCLDVGSVQRQQPVAVPVPAPAISSVLLWMLAGFIALVGSLTGRRFAQF